MAKNAISQYSTVAALNTDISGININTGWPPSNVGPAFRENMALLAKVNNAQQYWNNVPIQNATGTTGSWVINTDGSNPGKLQFRQFNNGGTLVATPLVLNAGTVTVTGNLDVSGTMTAGAISGSINLGSGNITTTGTITGGRIVTSGTAVAGLFSGPINAGSGTITTTGTVTGARVVAVGTVAGTALTASGAITGGSLNVSGNAILGGGSLSSGALACATINLTGSTSTSTSGWQMNPAGTGAFSLGTVNWAVNASGHDVLANRFIAACDARLKPKKRKITPEEGMKFLLECPSFIYFRRGHWESEYGSWEAGFLAQDLHRAGFDEVLLKERDEHMPAEAEGESGPVGERWLMLEKAPVAYLAAAVRALKAELDTLRAQIATNTEASE
jgi:hypothetical protein